MKVVVTGVSRGIGKAIVQNLLKRQIKCIGITRSKQAVDTVLLEDQLFHCIEWGDQNLDAFVIANKELLSNTGVLINNAADIIVKSVSEINERDLKQLFNTNLVIPYMLIRNLINEHCFTSGAHILNISSMGGYQGAAKFPGLSAYSISKAALVAMTESMAVELNDVNINCLCLGAVQTEMLSKAFPGYKSEISDADMAKYIVDFSLSNANLMSGWIVPVKKSDPIQ